MKKRCLALALFSFAPVLLAEPLSAPVLERYEQMLLRTPEPGTPFDKIYQHYLETQGLDALAQRWNEAAAKGGTDQAEYLLLSGLLADRRGKSDEALKILRSAAENSNNWRPWFALAGAEGRAGKLDSAVTSYQKALALNPPTDVLSKLYRGLALCQQRLMDADGAAATWQAYAKASPNDPFVLEEAGAALLESARYDEAHDMFAALRDMKDADPARKLNATLKLAEVEDRRGNKKEALKIYTGALAEAGDAGWVQREVRARIEKLFRSDDDIPGLVAFYRERLKADPSDLETALLLSQGLYELNRNEEALTVLQTAAEKAPDNKDIQIKLAQAQLRAERPADAEKTLLALQKAHPDDPSVIEQLGEAQWQSFKLGKGDKEVALATWRKLAEEKAEVNAVQRLAEVFRAHELADEAVKEYRRALDLDPAANDRRERLSDYLMQLDRRADAMAVLAGMVEGDRASGDNYLRLAKIQRRYGDLVASRASLQTAAHFPERAFERDYLGWQIASESNDWAAAEPLALALRKSAQSDPEIERADECFAETARQLDHANEEIRKLLTRHEKDPASFSERDYRLLFILGLNSGDEGTSTYALLEGQKQFPKSAMLAKLDMAYARRVGDVDRRIAALTLLEKLEPQRAGDWMAERVRAYRDADRPDEAIALARSIVQLAPAKTDSQMLLADTLLAAQKQDEAIKVLQEAIPLSDTPNQIRLRLADLYLTQAQYDAARQVLDEAFEAEDSADGKLQLTNRLASVYLQDGKIDDFITKLRERQKAEQGGWRYALYLAEVYLMMQDTVHAMEELDKALAGKPDDPALLKKLYSLADTNGDTEAALRYARKLMEVEPSRQNRAELGEALAEDGKLDEALALIKDNSAEFLDDPSAWQETTRILQAEEKTADLASLLEGKLRATPGDWRSLLTLAELLMTSGQVDKARNILWEIVAMKEPPAAAAASPSPSPAPSSMVGTGVRVFRSSMGSQYFPPGMTIAPAQMRQIRFSETYQQALQMLSNDTQNNRYSRIYRNRMMMGMPQQSGSVADLAEARDRATVYLACLAMQDGKEVEFIKKLTESLKDKSPLEKLTLYGMLQSPDLSLQLIKDFVDSGSTDSQMANMAFQTLQSIIGQRQNNTGAQVSASLDELKELAAKLSDRIAATAQPQNALQRYQMLNMLGKKEEADKLVDEILSQTDTTDPAQLSTAMSFALMRRDFDKALKYRELLKVARAKNGAVRSAGQDFGLAMQLMSADGYRQKGIDLLAEEFSSSSASNSMMPYFGNRSMQYAWPQMRAGLAQLMPVPTHDLNAQQINMLRSFGMQNPQMSQYLPDILKRFTVLAAEQQSSTLQQAVIWLQWFAGQQNEAESAMKALIEKRPDDDLLLNYSMMLAENKKVPEALKVLDNIKARSGNTYEIAARLRFALALRAGKQDIARDAALKLVALRVVDYEQSQLIEEMKRLGMAADAAKLAQKTAVSRNPTTRSRQMVDVMRSRMEAGNKDEAQTLAYAILSRDPLSRGARDERYQQQEALRTLDRLGELKNYIAKLKTQLDAAPQSVRLNIQLAQALQIKDPRDAEPYYRKLAELRPKDAEWLQQLGNLLMQSEQNEEAMRLYDKVLAENPSVLFSQGTSFMEPYRRTKNLQRLVDSLVKAPSHTSNLGFGYQQNYSQIFMEIGRQLQRMRPPVDPTDVWLKALEWDPVGSTQIRPLLAKSLAEQGRKDEARKVIEDAFFPPGQDQSTVRVFVYNRQFRPNNIWNQTTSYGNGDIQNEGVRLMRLAALYGFLDELLPKFEHLTPRPNEIDPKMFAHIVARDPGILPQVRELLDKTKAAKPNVGFSPGAMPPANPQVLRMLANELSDWPQARDLAYTALDVAAQAIQNGGGVDYNGLMGLYLQKADLALEDNKRELAQKSLENWAKALKDWQRQGASIDVSVGVRVARLMAAAGLTTQVDQLIETLKSDPNYARNTYYQRMLRQAENEIAILQGKTGEITPTLVWLPDQKGGRIAWDLRPSGGPDEDGRTVWMMDQPLSKVPSGYTLDVYFGTSENSMKKLFSKPAATARGSWSGTLPASNGFVRAVLHKGDDMRLGPASPASSGSPMMLPSALEEVLKAKSGTAKGWSSIPPAGATWLKGGPLGDGFLRIDGDRQDQAELTAERMAIDPRKNYLVGGWFRYEQNNGNGRIGWRIYDAKGKELSNYSGNGNFMGDRWNYATQRFGRSGNNVVRLPDSAAWIEPFVEFNGRCDLQGLFVSEVTPDQPSDD